MYCGGGGARAEQKQRSSPLHGAASCVPTYLGEVLLMQLAEVQRLLLRKAHAPGVPRLLQDDDVHHLHVARSDDDASDDTAARPD
jgi:hypothetical protein